MNSGTTTCSTKTGTPAEQAYVCTCVNSWVWSRHQLPCRHIFECFWAQLRNVKQAGQVLVCVLYCPDRHAVLLVSRIPTAHRTEQTQVCVGATYPSTRGPAPSYHTVVPPVQGIILPKIRILDYDSRLIISRDLHSCGTPRKCTSCPQAPTYDSLPS